ncbi:MAG: MarR family transcriptional regulator, partial [Planctomycetota bacterium]
DRFLAGHGLTHGRWLTLVVLHRRPEPRASPSELAQDQGVTRATMTGLLANLESSGLVRRETDAADGRRAVVVMTPKGRRLVDRLLPKVYDHINRQMAPISERDRRTLTRLLGHLIRE